MLRPRRGWRRWDGSCNLARFQRAPEGSRQSAAGSRHNVVQGRGMRVRMELYRVVRELELKEGFWL
jgi:hypothetical protein